MTLLWMVAKGGSGERLALESQLDLGSNSTHHCHPRIVEQSASQFQRAQPVQTETRAAMKTGKSALIIILFLCLGDDHKERQADSHTLAWFCCGYLQRSYCCPS